MLLFTNRIFKKERNQTPLSSYIREKVDEEVLQSAIDWIIRYTIINKITNLWRYFYHMKKILSALVALTLIYSPLGSFVFQDQPTSVEAKGYKSGKRGFNSNIGNKNKSNFQQQQKKQDNNVTNKSTTPTTPKGGFLSGGLMKGLMLGGLAGFLFGGLLGGMGMLGSFLGLMINVLAIYVLISIIRKIFVMIKDRKKKETDPWQR